MEIKVKRINEKAILPIKATDGSAGYDLFAYRLVDIYSGNEKVDDEKLKNIKEKEHFFLRAGERALVSTGLIMEIPKGYVGNIRPRSGKALKQGLMVANSPGTIDSDYRSEVGVILYNPTQRLLKVELGEKIAQLVITTHEEVNFTETKELTETERGAGGFGSTGK